VAPSEHEITLVPAPRTAVKLEPVSPRLKDTLIFPERSGYVQTLRYSPDGRQLLAGSYPSGVVQLYDVATRKQLTKIETGSDRADQFYFVTPDWKTLYAPRRTKRVANRVEKDSKKLIRWECEGEVRAWDLATGELKDTFRHDPPRGILRMHFSPDGRFFWTLEEVSGESETGVQWSVTVWNARTKQHKSFPETQFAATRFSLDSKTITTTVVDNRYMTTAIKIFDVETLTEKRVFPIKQNNVITGYINCFSPDGRLMVGPHFVYPNPKDRNRSEYSLMLRDVETGEVVMQFAPEDRRDSFLSPDFSHDGRILVARNRSGDKSKLFLFDMRSRKLARTVIVGESGAFGAHAFSPDDTWLAASSLVMPPGVRNPSTEEIPQLRIHLIEVATGEIKETLIAPQGGITNLAFSPDGITLATGGIGKVFLWDLSTPPGAAATTGR
jgi:WD40 repeat protein